MKLLILGRSSVVQRRVLPELCAHGTFETIDIASASNPRLDDPPAAWQGRIFESYQTALRDSEADIVYVSLINSLHDPWVRASLETGRYTVVDKPAFLTLEAAEAAVSLAEARGTGLAEAQVFADHPRVRALQDGLPDLGERLCVDAQFVFPTLPAGNYRNDPTLGGGALNDVGPYAAATARLVFGDMPQTLSCSMSVDPAAPGLDRDFAILATFSCGGRLRGHFGVGYEYRNVLTVTGSTGHARMDRAFTPPFESTSIHWRIGNRESTQHVRPAHPFGVFFDRLAARIDDGTLSSYHSDLLYDAAFRDAIMRAGGDAS